MGSFFKLVAAGPMFFVSAWLLMLIVGATHTDVGIKAFGYPTAMVVTIGLWLAVAPAIGAVAGAGRPRVAGGRSSAG
jgi:hypothetical protein